MSIDRLRQECRLESAPAELSKLDAKAAIAEYDALSDKLDALTDERNKLLARVVELEGDSAEYKRQREELAEAMYSERIAVYKTRKALERQVAAALTAEAQAVKRAGELEAALRNPLAAHETHCDHGSLGAPVDVARELLAGCSSAEKPAREYPDDKNVRDMRREREARVVKDCALCCIGRDGYGPEGAPRCYCVCHTLETAATEVKP